MKSGKNRKSRPPKKRNSSKKKLIAKAFTIAGLAYRAFRLMDKLHDAWSEKWAPVREAIRHVWDSF